MLIPCAEKIKFRNSLCSLIWSEPFGKFFTMCKDDNWKSREHFEGSLKKSLRVDTRYSVLEFKSANNYFYVFTDSISNAIHISETYQNGSFDFRIKVVLLPDRTVGDYSKGICHVGVAPVRRSAGSTNEQITQILYGETFDTLQVEAHWVRVRLHADGYIGWVSSDQVTLFDDERFYNFQLLPKVYSADHIVGIHEEPARTSPVIRETVYGVPLSVTGRHGSFLKIILPDGATGWVEKSMVRRSIRVKNLSVRKLLETARSFMGIPYVWGGRSSKGFDCSGFVQTIYRLNGIEIPRDSDMQFSAGYEVGRNMRELRAGDLLFFSLNGDKISHVAIYAGKNREFIHASGFVRINSFDPERKNFSRKLSSTFVGARRVI